MNDELFTDGKNTVQPLKPESLFEEQAQAPESIADAVLQFRKEAVAASVKSNVALSAGIKAVGDEREKLIELYRILVDRKILSNDDVKVGFDSSGSRLSMLSKISQYHHVILDERILPLLEPGYSVLYQLVLLFEELEKTNGHH